MEKKNLRPIGPEKLKYKWKFPNKMLKFSSVGCHVSILCRTFDVFRTQIWIYVLLIIMLCRSFVYCLHPAQDIFTYIKLYGDVTIAGEGLQI